MRQALTSLVPPGTASAGSSSTIESLANESGFSRASTAGSGQHTWCDAGRTAVPPKNTSVAHTLTETARSHFPHNTSDAGVADIVLSSPEEDNVRHDHAHDLATSVRPSPASLPEVAKYMSMPPPGRAARKGNADSPQAVGDDWLQAASNRRSRSSIVMSFV